MCEKGEKIIEHCDGCCCRCPIYRIYQKKYFLQILTDKKDVLVNPSCWEDPFDNFLFKCTKVVVEPGKKVPLDQAAKGVFGQCWTTNSENDAMWRIYSPGKDGIMVKSTRGKIRGNLHKYLCRHLSKHNPNLKVGDDPLRGSLSESDRDGVIRLLAKLIDVQYVKREDIKKFALELDLDSLNGSMLALDMLGVKREAFRHESEVRLVYFGDAESKCNADVFQFDLDPNEAFDEVILDPRTAVKEAKLLKRCLKNRGFNKPTRRSTLYDSPKFVIPLEAG